MNKKVIIIVLLIIFIPVALAAIWFFSVSGSNYTPSNVSLITLSNGEKQWEYTDEAEKELFTSVVNNFVSIESQTFSDEVWKLYSLELERMFGTDTFWLCLSQNPKNCLAYDVDGNWYRINTDDARKILVRGEFEGIYSASTYPELTVSYSGIDHKVAPREYEWSYLMADGGYSTISDTSDDLTETDFNISASNGIDFSFSIAPDWCDVKIFDGNALVFSGDLSTIADFSYSKDVELRALVSAAWYQDDSRLYYGTTLTEFEFAYNVAATATLNKDSFIPGEIVWVVMENAYNEEFDLSTTLDTSDTLSVREYNGKHYVSLPISMNNKTGEYNVSIKSDGTDINLKFTVSERLLEDATVKLISSSASEYETALQNFGEEISLSSYKSSLTFPLWKDGFVTPVIKFEDNKECYWVSAPSFGTTQIVNGMKISVKNFGTHYVKSVDFESIKARAVADGVVAFSGETTAFGNTLVLDHGFGLYTVYGHLDALKLNTGDSVKQSDVIGMSSNRGIVMKDGQIFFAIIQDGVFVNPYMLINEQKTSIDAELTLAPIEF